MINIYTIPARSLQKSYKSIIEEVKANKKPVVLTSNSQPQAAIVSLEDLEELKMVRAKQGTLKMLELAHKYREDLKKLPANLRERADEILYGKED